jgi:hypothetical protein
VLFSLTCFGQNNERVQIFGGYSLQRLSTGDVSGGNLDNLFGAPAGTFSVKSFLSGWNAEVQYNVTSRYGLVLDASGHYGHPVTASSSSGYTGAPEARSYWYLIGPTARFPKGKWTPYVRVMAGKNTLHSNFSEAVALYGTAGDATSNGSFAAAAGGGLDWPVKKHFAVRLPQIDYLYTRHNAAPYASSLFGTSALASTSNYQNAFRVSAGLVYHFGW